MSIQRNRFCLPTLSTRCGLLIVLLCFAGCGPSGCGSGGYRSAVQSGFTAVPEALEIERLYGEADHFIGRQQGGIHKWNTVTVVEGRYRLAMECDVRLNWGGDAIEEVLTEPLFYISEIQEIRVSDDGGVSTSYSRSNQTQLDRSQWRKVVDADGDLSAIGMDFKRNSPVKNVEEYRRGWSRDIIKVRPARDALEQKAELPYRLEARR